MRKAGAKLISTKYSWNCCAVLKMVVFSFHIFCCFWAIFIRGWIFLWIFCFVAIRNIKSSFMKAFLPQFSSISFSPSVPCSLEPASFLLILSILITLLSPGSRTRCSGLSLLLSGLEGAGEKHGCWDIFIRKLKKGDCSIQLSTEGRTGVRILTPYSLGPLVSGGNRWKQMSTWGKMRS